MFKLLLAGFTSALIVSGTYADTLPPQCTLTNTVNVRAEVSTEVTTTVAATIVVSTATETAYDSTITETIFTATQTVVTETSVSIDTVFTTTITSTSYIETVSVPTFTSINTITDLTTITDIATVTSVAISLSGSVTVSTTTDTFQTNAGQKRDYPICTPVTTAWPAIVFLAGNSTTTSEINSSGCATINVTITTAIPMLEPSTTTATISVTEVSTVTIPIVTTITQSSYGTETLLTASTFTLTTISTLTVLTSTITHVPSTTTTVFTVTTTSTSISSVPTVQITRARIYHRVYGLSNCAWYGSNSDLGGDSPSDTFGSSQGRTQYIANLCDQTDGCVNFYFYMFLDRYTNYGLSATSYADSGNFCFDAAGTGQDAEAWDLVSDIVTTVEVT